MSRGSPADSSPRRSTSVCAGTAWAASRERPQVSLARLPAADWFLVLRGLKDAPCEASPLEERGGGRGRSVERYGA